MPDVMGDKKKDKKKGSKKSSKKPQKTKSVAKPPPSGGDGGKPSPKWYEWIAIVILIICGVGSVLVGPFFLR